MKNYPIGVFDSGIGGLTVVREIIDQLPGESLIYLGDTARVPYGTRGKKVITKFALELVDFLLKKKVKMLVAACNTISATCLDVIEYISPVPVLGVVKSAAKLAVDTTKSGIIGVIGTSATINSKTYQKQIGKRYQILTQACPLFVPLAEEGLIKHPATKFIAKDYLKDLSKTKMDTLILGCTHYPVLEKTIQEVVGRKVKLIDSAKPTANKLKEILEKNNLLAKSKAKYQFFITDAPARVNEVAATLFEGKLPAKLLLTSV